MISDLDPRLGKKNSKIPFCGPSACSAQLFILHHCHQAQSRYGYGYRSKQSSIKAKV